MKKPLFLLILIVLSACSKSTNKPNVIQDLIIENDSLSFEFIDKTLETSLADDFFELTEINQGEKGILYIDLKNKEFDTKTVTIISQGLINFDLTSSCSSLMRNRSCRLEIKTKNLSQGIYEDFFMINNYKISLKIKVNAPILSSGVQELTVPAVVELSTELKIIIRNPKIISLPVNLNVSQIGQDISVINNCPTVLVGRRTCSINLKLNEGTSSGTQILKVNEQNLSITINRPIIQNESNFSSSVTNVTEEITEDKIIKLTISNKSFKKDGFTLNLPSFVEVVANNCPAAMERNRRCTIYIKINYNLLSSGNNSSSIIINNITIPLNITKTEVLNCLGPNRISSSLCDNEVITEPLNKHVVNNQLFPDAVCNDGSPAVFYHRKGIGSGTNRWVIHLEEGGFCGILPIFFSSSQYIPLNNCNDRQQNAATTYLTSSVLSPSEYGNAYYFTQGILNHEQSKNPDFYTWNHVEIRYCSSDLWSGDNQQTISSSLWKFKGKKIIDAVISTLKSEYDLDDATNIILSGSSAGGVGVLNQGDAIKETYFVNKDVSILSDSGFIFDKTTKINAPIWNTLFQLNKPYLNATSDISCQSRLGPLFLDCFFGSKNKNDIVTEKFIIQDQLDSFYLSYVYQTNLCTADASTQAWINSYSQELRDSIYDLSGVISLRKFNHVFSMRTAWNQLVNNDLKMREIYANWYFNTAGIKKYIQQPIDTLSIERASLCQ